MQRQLWLPCRRSSRCETAKGGTLCIGCDSNLAAIVFFHCRTSPTLYGETREPSRICPYVCFVVGCHAASLHWNRPATTQDWLCAGRTRSDFEHLYASGCQLLDHEDYRP